LKAIPDTHAQLAGDKWCLCARAWGEALEANVAPPLYLKATHQKVGVRAV